MKYLILFSVFILQACVFSAGSYHYAEYYEFDMSRTEIIERINEFKQKNPEYKVMTTVENGDIREVSNSNNGVFYELYFHIKEKNLTFHCFINMSSEIKNTHAELGLSGVTYSKNFAYWYKVNTTDLTKEENLEIKKIFEEKILNQLGKWRHM